MTTNQPTNQPPMDDVVDGDLVTALFVGTYCKIMIISLCWRFLFCSRRNIVWRRSQQSEIVSNFMRFSRWRCPCLRPTACHLLLRIGGVGGYLVITIATVINKWLTWSSGESSFRSVMLGYSWAIPHHSYNSFIIHGYRLVSERVALLIRTTQQLYVLPLDPACPANGSPSFNNNSAQCSPRRCTCEESSSTIVLCSIPDTNKQASSMQ